MTIGALALLPLDKGGLRGVANIHPGLSEIMVGRNGSRSTVRRALIVRVMKFYTSFPRRRESSFI